MQFREVLGMAGKRYTEIGNCLIFTNLDLACIVCSSKELNLMEINVDYWNALHWCTVVMDGWGCGFEEKEQKFGC